MRSCNQEEIVRGGFERSPVGVLCCAVLCLLWFVPAQPHPFAFFFPFFHLSFSFPLLFLFFASPPPPPSVSGKVEPSSAQLAAIKQTLHIDDQGNPTSPNPASGTGGTPSNKAPHGDLVTPSPLAAAEEEQVVAIKNGDLECGEGAGAGAGAGAEAKQSAAGATANDSDSKADGAAAAKPEAGEGGDEDDDEGGRFDWPDNLADQILFVVSFPYLVAFTYTIPDCSTERWKEWYIVAFGMSILWIGGLCWVMVVMASLVGCILDIDPPVMGIVVLAVGTSIPDALGSMIVARQGEADMAIANAVGSNVFDILLGLGLPWFLSYFVHDAPTEVNVEGIGPGLVILFCTILLFLGVIAINKFRFNSRLGWVFLCSYFVYLTYTLLAEYCVDGIPVAGDRCDSA